MSFCMGVSVSCLFVSAARIGVSYPPGAIVFPCLATQHGAAGVCMAQHDSIYPVGGKPPMSRLCRLIQDPLSTIWTVHLSFKSIQTAQSVLDNATVSQMKIVKQAVLNIEYGHCSCTTR